MVEIISLVYSILVAVVRIILLWLCYLFHAFLCHVDELPETANFSDSELIPIHHALKLGMTEANNELPKQICKCEGM